MKEKAPRFSKSAFREELLRRAQQLMDSSGFDPNNGWAQVRGCPTQKVVDYGRFRTLLDLAEELS